jgi:hypothetical protein
MEEVDSLESDLPTCHVNSRGRKLIAFVTGAGFSYDQGVMSSLLFHTAKQLIKVDL